MCTFDERVHECGHYKKTLSNPCDDAKKNKEVCSSSSVSSSTTGAMCSFDGCDKKAEPKREGPAGRSDGDFNSMMIDWDEY